MDTIIATHYGSEHFRPLVLEDTDIAPLADLTPAGRLFKIRAANTEGHRSSANILVNRMYAWRGYKSSAKAPVVDAHHRITLVAEDHDDTVGTMSIGFDGAKGLFVDQLFAGEVQSLRDEGRAICEFTKLAVDGVVKSKRVLASLFHVAYIYAYLLKGFDSLLIEVNPRHVRYYERMLGFRKIGPVRMNPRVEAPAVLMCLDFSHAQRQIETFGGRPESALVERSLYPYFFSGPEEFGIVARLKDTQALAEGPQPRRAARFGSLRFPFAKRPGSLRRSPQSRNN